MEHVNNILSVECLDVVIPTNKNILKEPYLWLCIDEWGSSNIGPGVPEGAFARLKAVPSNGFDLPFITMRAHILERQHPNVITDQLTIRLLTSDGEPIDIEDKVEVSEVSEVIKDLKDLKDLKDHEVFIKVVNPKVDIKVDDKLYFYSLYNNDVVGFYPNVYIHDIKIISRVDTKIDNKDDIDNIDNINNIDKLSLRLFVDNDADNTDNRIGKFISKKTKERIVSSKYLSVGDLLFLEFMKTKSSKVSEKFEIIDIKDDIIIINFPQPKRKFIPKKILKVGFIKKKSEGWVSHNKEDLNYKGGVLVKKIDGDKIYLDFKVTKDINNNLNLNKYFFLNRKTQTSYMFRITYN